MATTAPRPIPHAHDGPGQHLCSRTLSPQVSRRIHSHLSSVVSSVEYHPSMNGLQYHQPEAGPSNYQCQTSTATQSGKSTHLPPISPLPIAIPIPSSEDHLRLIHCQWPFCNAQLASVGILKKHVRRHFLQVEMLGRAERLEIQIQGLQSSQSHCLWGRCGEANLSEECTGSVRQLERHWLEVHRPGLDALHRLEGTLTNIVNGFESSDQDIPSPDNLTSLFTTRPTRVQPQKPPPIPPPLRLYPEGPTPTIQPYTRNKDKVEIKPPAPTYTLRRQQAQAPLHHDKHAQPNPICPIRNDDDPFWPTCGDAIAGAHTDQAISSSIFPFPLVHASTEPSPDADDVVYNLLRVAKRKQEEEELKVDPGLDGLECPLLSITPPGNDSSHHREESNARTRDKKPKFTIRITNRPARPKRPNLPSSGYAARNWSIHQKQPKSKAVGIAIASEEVGIVHEESTRSKVMLAAERRASTVTSRSFGMTNWEARMGFIRRGRALGEVKHSG